MSRVLVVLALAGCATGDRVIDHDLFVSDYAADAIVRFDGATGELLGTFAAGSEQRVDRPASVRPAPDGGQLYAAGFGRGEIVRYSATGTMMDVFYSDTTLLEEPVELAFHGDDLIVLGNDTASAVVIDAHGRTKQAIGYPVMRGAHDFVLDGGRMIVGADQHPELGHAIQIWDLASGALVGHFGATDELATATGLALAGETLYVADWERDRVVTFDLATGAYRGVFAEALVGPISLELGPDGDLYVLDRDGVHRFDATTGAPRGTLVDAGTTLQFPRSFTFVPR